MGSGGRAPAVATIHLPAAAIDAIAIPRHERVADMHTGRHVTLALNKARAMLKPHDQKKHHRGLNAAADRKPRVLSSLEASTGITN